MLVLNHIPKAEGNGDQLLNFVERCNETTEPPRDTMYLFSSPFKDTATHPKIEAINKGFRLIANGFARNERFMKMCELERAIWYHFLAPEISVNKKEAVFGNFWKENQDNQLFMTITEDETELRIWNQKPEIVTRSHIKSKDNSRLLFGAHFERSGIGQIKEDIRDLDIEKRIVLLPTFVSA
jgi:hypothetical protein